VISKELNHHEEGRLELFNTGEGKAFLLVVDSEDLLAVVIPVALRHADELIDV